MAPTAAATASAAHAIAPWASVSRELTARGLDEAQFARAVLAALKATGALSADGADGEAAAKAAPLTAEEAGFLHAGGFTLAPRSDREGDVRLETTARLATTILDSKDTATVARDLGVSTARIRQRAAVRSLYGLRIGGEWRFPRWQFDPVSGAPMPGAADVVAALPAGLHPIAVERFFTEPCPDLEIDDTAVSPVAWLRAGGDPDVVASIAREL